MTIDRSVNYYARMKKCQTRERLLETAMNLIWTESYGSVGVDEICRTAKIQKGSFYHFFPSKVALAVAALTEAWQKHRPKIDLLFCGERKPLDRLKAYLEFSIEKQVELKRQFGFFPGCPFTAIGMEQGGRQEILRKTAETHLDYVKAYFEKAVRDGIRDGVFKVRNPAQKASEIFSLYLGAFTRLRITNDLSVMHDLQTGVWALLGVSEKKTLYPKTNHPASRVRAKKKQLSAV